MRLLIFGIVLASCGRATEQPPGPATVAVAEPLNLEKFHQKGSSDYASAKQQCLSVRSDLRKRYEEAKSDTLKKEILKEAASFLTKQLISDIIPWWYGTPWTFSGYTAEPGQGTVACGYFVSTTLQHSGFNINRYSLAQQAPRAEAITINLSNKLIALENSSREDAINFFKAANIHDGLYFAGLDFHVGYLVKEKQRLFFIHSNWIGAQGVVIEPAESSEAFKSHSYYIAPISNNEALLKKWILNEPVKIHKEPVSTDSF